MDGDRLRALVDVVTSNPEPERRIGPDRREAVREHHARADERIHRADRLLKDLDALLLRLSQGHRAPGDVEDRLRAIVDRYRMVSSS